MTFSLDRVSRRVAGYPFQFVLLALALGLSSCDEESSAGPDTSPVEQTRTIRSVDPIPARFFRLTAPVSFYFTDADSFPTPMEDDSFDLVASEQNPAAPWEVDYSSLQVYRSVGPGLSQGELVDNAVAYLDASGIGFEGFGVGTGMTPGDSGPNPGYPHSGFDPAVALGSLPQQYRPRWELLQSPEDWKVVEVDDQVIGIQLSRTSTGNEIVAVSYDIIDAVSGAVVRRAGRSVYDGEDGRITYPLDPSRQINYFKLLKPGGPVSQPFDGNAYTEFALTWEYEYRNFYDLVGNDIDLHFFEFNIVSTDTTVAPPNLMPAQNDSTQASFIRVFGLDQQTGPSGRPLPDGLADKGNRDIFDLETGIVRFPHPTPMNLPDSLAAEYTWGRVLWIPPEMKAPGLYTRLLTWQERDALHRFDFEVWWLE